MANGQATSKQKEALQSQIAAISSAADAPPPATSAAADATPAAEPVTLPEVPSAPSRRSPAPPAAASAAPADDSAGFDHSFLSPGAHEVLTKAGLLSPSVRGALKPGMADKPDLPTGALLGEVASRPVPAAPGTTPTTPATPEDQARAKLALGVRAASEKIDKTVYTGNPKLDAIIREQQKGQLRTGLETEEQAGAAEKTRLQSEQAAAGERRTAAESGAAKMERENAAIHAATTEQLEGVHKDLDELRNTKPDPDHWWSHKSTGQKVGSVLGLMLSGFGGQASTKNMQEMLHHEMDQDLEAQKMGIQKGIAVASEDQRRLEGTLSRLATPEAQANMRRAFMLDGVTAKIDQEAAARGLAANDARVIAAKQAVTEDAKKRMQDATMQHVASVSQQAQAYQAYQAAAPARERKVRLEESAIAEKESQASAHNAQARKDDRPAEPKAAPKPSAAESEAAQLGGDLRKWNNIRDEDARKTIKVQVERQLGKGASDALDTKGGRTKLLEQIQARAGAAGGGARSLEDESQ